VLDALTEPKSGKESNHINTGYHLIKVSKKLYCDKSDKEPLSRNYRVTHKLFKYDDPNFKESDREK